MLHTVPCFRTAIISFFFVIPAFSLFSFKCKFDVILFCLLRTSENFQTLRRSLTTNKVSMRMIICGEDVDRVTRSCLWSKSRRRQSMLSFSNPPYVDDCYSHSQNFWTSLDFVFCRLFSLFLPFGITVSVSCTSMTYLSSYAPCLPAFT